MLKGRVVKQCGHFTIDVEFQCDRGSLLALTGPSGAGKTTIIRMLAGLEKPDTGHIEFDGEDWFDSAAKIDTPARMRKVGYVFQEHTLFPHLTIEKNAGYSCRDKTRVKELLTMLGISHLARRMPCQISGGERQRAALAQALASDPGALFLDEPFSALDATTRIRLREELKRLKNRLDIPVVLVTHDLEDADYLADRVISLPQPKAAVSFQTENEHVKQNSLICHWQCEA